MTTTDEQISLYAIGAMDAREAADFERQLAQSPDLRARVTEEKAATMAMLTAIEPVMPSPAVKQRLMSRVGGAAVPATQPQPSQSQQAGLGDIWRWLFGGLAAAFAALAVVMGVGLVNTQSQVSQLQSQFGQAQARLEGIQSELQSASERAAKLEGDLAQAKGESELARQAAATASSTAQKAQTDVTTAQAKTQQIQDALTHSQTELAVLSQADVRTVTLPSNKTEFQNGAVTVFYAPRSKSALITVANLPALASDRDYQVWLIKDGVALPSSVFDTTVTGDGRLLVTSDEPFEKYQSVGITIEPTRGRPTPNPDGPIYLGPLG